MYSSFFSLHTWISAVLLVLLTSATTPPTNASTMHNCRFVEQNFSFSISNSAALSTSDSPRRVVVSLNITLSPGATIDPLFPVNITFANNTVGTYHKLKPLFFAVDVAKSFNEARATLNITNVTVVVRSTTGFESTVVVGGLNFATLRVGRLCGRIMEKGNAARFDFVKARIGYTGTTTTMFYADAVSHCRSIGMRLPTLLKTTDYAEFKLSWDANPASDYFLGSMQYDWRPSWAGFCWIEDFDYDAELCNNNTAAVEYFAFYRSNAASVLQCKSAAIACAANAADVGYPDWDNLSPPSGSRFATRVVRVENWKWRDHIINKVHCASCMKLVTYKGVAANVTVLDFATITPSQTFSDPLPSAVQTATKIIRTVSASYSDNPTETSTVSSRRLSPSLTNPASATSSGSESTHTASPSQRSPSPFIGTMSQVPTLTSPPSQSHSKSPQNSLSLSLSTSNESTPTVSDSYSSRITASPSQLEATPSRVVTPAQTKTTTRSSSLGSLSRTLYRTKTPIPPPVPLPPSLPVANAIPVAEAAAIAATSTLAATLAAPAAAQTLRSMSILGTVGTEERCKLLAIGRDAFASAAPRFPESFLPFVVLPGGNGNKTQEETFALPHRRGAIVANCLIAPLVIVAAALVAGFVRKRVQRPYANVSVLTAGRVPGITCSLVGALFADGVFGNATILLAQNDVAAGDVVLSVFGLSMILAVVIFPGVLVYRAMREGKELGWPVECVQCHLQRKGNMNNNNNKAKKNEVSNETQPHLDEHFLNYLGEESALRGDDGRREEITGFIWFLFGDETWSGDVEIVERYRSIFATSRGLNSTTEVTFTKFKRIRRHAATWSFFVDVAMTMLAAIARGYATADPCGAHNKVQLLQFAIAAFAFFFSLCVLAPISPMRRLASVAADFVMFLGTMTLVALGSESAQMVGRCALAAAFMATASSLALFVIRRIVLPLMGIAIVGAAKLQSKQQQEVHLNRQQDKERGDVAGINDSNNNNIFTGRDGVGRVAEALGNLLVLPVLSVTGDGEVDETIYGFYGDEPNSSNRRAEGKIHRHGPTTMGGVGFTRSPSQTNDNNEAAMHVDFGTTDNDKPGVIGENGDEDEEEMIDLGDLLTADDVVVDEELGEKRVSQTWTFPQPASCCNNVNSIDIWAQLGTEEVK